jgi:hypothetical protein
MKLFRPVIVIAAAVPSLIFAHHGWSEYDSSKALKLTGKMVESGYEHPHVHVHLETRAHHPERRDRPAEMTGEVGGTALGALEASGLGQAMRQSPWLYPAVEIVHIVGIGLLFGSIAILDLRLLGLSKSISVKRLASHVLPWSAAAFLLIVPSGFLMFTAHASDFISSPVFVVKMCLIMAAGLNAALFHTVVFPSVEVWDSEEMRRLGPPPSARVSAAVSLLVWISVIACGRLLAYF